MTGSIDQISQAIGGLQVSVANAADRAEVIEQKLDQVIAALANLKDLPKRVETLEEQAAADGQRRARAAGFVAGVSAIGGIVGSALTALATKFGFH